MSREQSKSPLASRQWRAFVARRLFSLTGVVPVGAFFVLHLWTYTSVLRGREAFDDAIRRVLDTPYLLFFEIVLIYLPLLFHALYGLKVSLEARPNVGRYTYSRNWMYTLQRITGIVAFAFICYHLWQFRIQIALGRMRSADLFPELCATLSSTTGAGIPLVAILYLLGIAAAVFHLANGLWGFCFSWGVTVSRASQRLAGAVFGVLGLLLFFMSAHTLIYLATGSALLGLGQPARKGSIVGCADVGAGATAHLSGTGTWAAR